MKKNPSPLVESRPEVLWGVLQGPGRLHEGVGGGLAPLHRQGVQLDGGGNVGCKQSRGSFYFFKNKNPFLPTAERTKGGKARPEHKVGIGTSPVHPTNSRQKKTQRHFWDTRLAFVMINHKTCKHFLNFNFDYSLYVEHDGNLTWQVRQMLKN